jgi:hypothetical protein
MDEHCNFVDDTCPEVRAKQTAALNASIADLESRSFPEPGKRSTIPTPLLSAALKTNAYYVANDRCQKATPYVRDRCIARHGMLVSDTIGTHYEHKCNRRRVYNPGDCEYDFRCAWSSHSDCKPPPYQLTPPAVQVNATTKSAGLPLPWSLLSSMPMSHVDIAAHDAIHPVADILRDDTPPPPSPPTPSPQVSAQAMADGIASLTLETFGRLSTADRTVLSMFGTHHRDAQYAAELVTPEGSAMYRLRSGPPPNASMVAPTVPGPPSYFAALNSPAWKMWLAAIHEEIKGQQMAGCWHWERLPTGAKLLRNVLVLTTKLHPDFTLDRPKARYCVDGSGEKPGEYSDVCAHVAQLSSFKTQVAATAHLEGKLYSGDWTQAYLRALNTVPQYMREPHAMMPKFARDGTRLVLRIARALYGGKGSAGLWDSCVDTWHTEYGFRRSNADPRLYILERGTARITMVLATDDTSTSVPNEKYYPGSHALYLEYTAALEADFERPDGSSGYTAKGITTDFIGIGVDQTVDGQITLDMRGTCTDIVAKEGFTDSHLAPAPGTPGKVLSETDCAVDGDSNAPNPTAYRSRIGKALWLARGALPIALYYVAALARFNHAPGKRHWNATNDLYRWLATAADARIVYKRTGEPLYYYVDSDFLPNYGTSSDNRRSTTGYCAFFAGACIHHVSRRQTTIATSTAHAEYLAAFDAGRDALRTRILLCDLGIPQVGATTMFEDNETCVKMSESSSSTPRMQHLDARYHWLREQVVTDHTLRLVYCPTTDMVADCFTKPLPGPAVRRFHGALSGLTPIRHPPFGGPLGRIGKSLHEPETMPLLSDV